MIVAFGKLLAESFGLGSSLILWKRPCCTVDINNSEPFTEKYGVEKTDKMIALLEGKKKKITGKIWVNCSLAVLML